LLAKPTSRNVNLDSDRFAMFNKERDIPQRGMPERRVDRIGLAAADQRTRAVATEIRDLRATGFDRACAQGGDTAAERVQNVHRQLLARLRREIGE
jgi:hypothetical protein